jgi:diketogulonate reductase-like aldo/keto reductase
MQDFAREEIFLTTKVLADNVRYDDLLRALDRSLEHLQTDHADLYLIHWPNPDVPLEESFRALNRVVAEGRVKRIGVSNFDVALLREAQELCETPVVTNQVRYNLYTRAPEQDGLLRYCQENNIVLTAYSPLKDGVMQNETVQAVARKHGATAAQVAIRWLTRQPQVVTIPMSTNRDHLRQNLEALALALDEEDVQRLNQASS